MPRFLKLLPFILFVQFGFAQYTELINSKRPGFSDSPYSVGTKVYQVESGFFYKNVGNYLYYDEFNKPFEYSSDGYGLDVFLRSGLFFERLELNLDMALANEERYYTQPQDSTASGFGLSRMTIGAKYLVYMPKYRDKSKEIRSWEERHKFDKRRLIPAVGIYVGLNTNLLMDMYKSKFGVSPRFAIFTQNDLTDRWILLMNFISDKWSFPDEGEYDYIYENSIIVTSTYTLTPKVSVFGEIQLFNRADLPDDFQFGAGGAYLINPNLQVDLSARMIYDQYEKSTYLFNTGVSWRLDRHKDKIIQAEANNDDLALPQEKKGFLGGLFAGSWFAKKSNDKKMREVKVKEAKSRSGLQAPVNKKAEKARKKRNKQLIKDQKQKEKAQKKYSKQENG
ncbi:transporter [Namhaeicola litoreus]|uniref:Transporter n=1 Tax=Namhaeicola litoreus TaxID=1052145 RepID=A0ABW3Y198_9FLAO